MLDFIFSKKNNTTRNNTNELLNRFVNNELTIEEINQNNYFSEYEFLDRPLQVAVIDFKSICGPSSEVCIPYNWLEKYFYEAVDNEEGFVFYDRDSRAVMVFFLDILWEEQVIGILDDIRKEALRRSIGELPLITVGEMVEDFEFLPVSYNHAVRIQTYSIIKPKGKIIYYYDIVARKSSYPSFIDISYNYMLGLVESRNYDEMITYVESAYKELSNTKLYNMGLVYNITFEIVINAYSALRQCHRDYHSIITSNTNISEEVLSKLTVSDVKIWILEFLKKCVNA